MGALKLIYKNSFESESTAVRFGLESENASGKKRRKKVDLKRVGAAILSGGASEVARKGKQFAKSKKGKAFGQKLKQFGKKGLLYAKYSALTPLFAPVLPFKIPMVAMLKKRGIKTNLAEPIGLVAEKFVKYIGKPMLAKGSRVEGANFTEAEMMEAFDINNFTGYETLENSNAENVAPVIAKAVTVAIQVIIQVFKNLKKKKESGERLSADERVGLETSEKTAELTADKNQEEVKQMMKEPTNTTEMKEAVKGSDTSSVADENKGISTEKKSGFSIKGLLPLGLIALIIFFIMKK